jgi:hypothetical protein
MRGKGHLGHMGKRRNAHRVMVIKPDGKRPLSRHKHKWEDAIDMNQRNRFSWYVLDSCGSEQGPVATLHRVGFCNMV